MKQKVIIHLFIILLIMICSCINIKSSIEIEKYELSRDISDSCINIKYTNVDECGKILVPLLRGKNKEETPLLKLLHNKVFTEDEKYMLAKIVMAEAENQDIRTKTLVIMSILNRVENEYFPDSISEVIFQNDGKIYQFSPIIPGGRYWTTEPNKDCYEAIEIVLSTEYDYSEGALYFESCEGDSWHNKNLTYLYQSGDLRFYK